MHVLLSRRIAIVIATGLLIMACTPGLMWLKTQLSLTRTHTLILAVLLSLLYVYLATYIVSGKRVALQLTLFTSIMSGLYVLFEQYGAGGPFNNGIMFSLMAIFVSGTISRRLCIVLFSSTEWDEKETRKTPVKAGSE